MAEAGHADAAVVAQSAAAIVGRLDRRMAELTGSIHQILVTRNRRAARRCAAAAAVA